MGEVNSQFCTCSNMRECASSKHTGNVIRGGTSSEVGRGVWYSVVDFNLCSGIAPDLTAGLEHSTYASLWRQGKVSPRYTQALSVSSSMLGVCAVEVRMLRDRPRNDK